MGVVDCGQRLFPTEMAYKWSKCSKKCTKIEDIGAILGMSSCKMTLKPISSKTQNVVLNRCSFFRTVV